MVVQRKSRKDPYTGSKAAPAHPAPQYDLNPNQYMSFFKFYGISLTKVVNGKGQLQGDCPFPDCENPTSHFYVNSGTGQWDCKRCQRTGNTTTFMRQFHQVIYEQQTDESFAQLCELRPGIAVATFKRYRIALFGVESILVPHFNKEGEIISLPVWRCVNSQNGDGTISFQVRNPPTVKLYPFGLQAVDPGERRELFICEGQWDTLALHTLFCGIKRGDHRLIELFDIIGTPGAGNFPKEHLGLLDGRTVNILFDNDGAGQKGTNALLNAISANGIIPTEVRVLEWPAYYPEGFDVRDLLVQGVLSE